MSDYRIASRYAKSLIDIAIEQNQVEEVNNDIHRIQQLMKSSHRFMVLLKSPVIPPDLKRKVIDELFAKNSHVITLKFLQLLVHKRRESHLENVIKEFIGFYNQYKKVTPVYFTTAVPVDPDVLDKLRSVFTQRTGVKDIELHTHVDEKIVGGFIFRYGDNLIDASVRRQLHKMDVWFAENPYEKQIGNR